ncbi:MAG: hypothetical protein COT31_04125 [Candidatus Moranbacteria bacterium CG08_land_8_20_14_0_20_34_16]|nr:MAG: hypothetical protein COT31_04125 [Candidatus Moranbacteria bacterium CG08_land_8_20_14_0_20_34_16]
MEKIYPMKKKKFTSKNKRTVFFGSCFFRKVDKTNTYFLFGKQFLKKIISRLNSGKFHFTL